MDWLFKASSPFKQFYLFLNVTILALLTACGGGGFEDVADPTDPTTPGATITITLSLTSANSGDTTQSITSSNPGKITATVTGITSPVIVTFTSTNADIPIPTAITDANNQATVDILAGSTLGAGTVTASVSTGEKAELVYAIGATNLRMGSGSPFQESVAAVSSTQISAGGTTTVTVLIVDEAGQPFTEAVDVNFSSACTRATPSTATLSSPIATINGVASSTYLAQGCVGDDAINITANAGGISLSASASVNVLSADVGSVEFVSATPENIAIVGAGGVNGSESSTVIFRVKDTNGNPVNGQLVNFTLNTDVGGIAINPTSATTNAQGLAQTVINSGTVATSVRVTATIDSSSPEISSQSSNLVVSTGIPDQDSFSLSASTANPEGWNIDGTEVDIVARLSDAFNNPVPDGTAVSFTTEGGSIESSCTTVNGACTVKWTSQNPRPEGQTLSANGLTPSVVNTMGQKFGGRATIIATAIGEESFPDTNGNGRFDASEMTAFGGTNISGLPYDLDEAFVDHNEDGIFNPSIAGGQTGGEIETFIDFNNDASFTQKDTLYNGVLCSIPAHAGCSSATSINVREKLVLVMSGSTAYFTISQTVDFPVNSDGNDSNDSVLNLQGESTGSVSVIIADLHNQPMPAGTTVSFTATKGSVQGTSSFTWPNDNHNGGAAFSVTIKGETTPGNGTLLIEVKTPSGLITTSNQVNIVVN
ncbi:Ig-like domain-containing protein [Aliikangiella sp. IMCC44359]|uniref:Ig-like domain-containing protein n=1 Tax=Aliikangiella sp. IMCC44359 TaxID=3459125 RepID=UPI00403A7E8B